MNQLTGVIEQVLAPTSGTSSSGNAWTKQTFVLKTVEQYPKHCAFTVFGAEKLAKFNIQQGETVTVYLDIDAHEYQGKWYNSINAYRVDRPGQQQNQQPQQSVPQQQPVQAQQSQAVAQEKKDDLPF